MPLYYVLRTCTNDHLEPPFLGHCECHQLVESCSPKKWNMARQYVQLSPNNCRLESKSLPSNKNSRMDVDGGDGFRGVGGPTFRMCLLVVENLANFTDRTMPFGFRVEWNFRSKSGRVIKSAYYIITSSVAELAVGSATPTRTHTGPSTKRNSLSPSCFIKGTVCVCTCPSLQRILRFLHLLCVLQIFRGVCP